MLSSANILFHFRKHHLDELKAHVHACSEEEFRTHLLSLGQSTFDLYYGNLSSEQIKQEILLLLHHQNISSEQEYQYWIAINKGFQLLLLSDGTSWTLRYLEGDHFVHLHPSRYAQHTRRIKSQHLKQALWLYRNKLTFTDEHVKLCRSSLGMSPTGKHELKGLQEIVALVHRLI